MTMSSKLSLSVITAFALAIGASRVGHAAAMETQSSNTESSNAQIDAAESGNPASVDYANRPAPSQPVTNDDINAAEQGNPHSFNYANRPPLQTDGNTNAEWQESESADPDAVH
jgi:hypothetical protein